MSSGPGNVLNIETFASYPEIAMSAASAFQKAHASDSICVASLEFPESKRDPVDAKSVC